MTPEFVFAAAVKIEDRALHYGALADKAERAGKLELAALHGAVSNQLRSHAGQVCLMANQARITGVVTPEAARRTAELLEYAGCV